MQCDTWSNRHTHIHTFSSCYVINSTCCSNLQCCVNLSYINHSDKNWCCHPREPVWGGGGGGAGDTVNLTNSADYTIIFLELSLMKSLGLLASFNRTYSTFFYKHICRENACRHREKDIIYGLNQEASSCGRFS